MYTVAIVGRPNVGKSALFNRLVGRRIAIVDSTYGLTRDRLSACVTWMGRRFTLVDTGGIDFKVSDNIREMARRQAQLAISQADTVILVTDVQEGLVPLDVEVAGLLREAGSRIIIVANKADNESLSLAASEFHQLGIPDIFAVSALHGLGIGPLLESIAGRISESEPEESDGIIKIAVVGKPNVGKSSYVNAVLREERLIVDEKPGTTRDSVDIHASWQGRRITLIDTAGLRHRRKLKEAAEFFSVARTRSSIRRCDLALMLIDAADELSRQDERIASLILDYGKGCVLAANKWDLVKRTDTRVFRDAVWNEMRFFNHVPLIFMSAKFNRGIEKSISTLFFVHEQMVKRIPTPILNRLLRSLWERNEPPVRRGKRPKFYYATQPSVKPPCFVLFVNERALIDKSYTHYLANGLRRAFGFEGATILINFKNRRR